MSRGMDQASRIDVARRKRGQGKVHKVMHEFKMGTLHSGSKHGPLVAGNKQALAIAMSEAGMSRSQTAKRKRSTHA